MYGLGDEHEHASFSKGRLQVFLEGWKKRRMESIKIIASYCFTKSFVCRGGIVERSGRYKQIIPSKQLVKEGLFPYG